MVAWHSVPSFRIAGTLSRRAYKPRRRDTEPGLEFRRRHRPAEEQALRQIAREGSQECGLFIGFHALGGYV